MRRGLLRDGVTDKLNCRIQSDATSFDDQLRVFALKMFQLALEVGGKEGCIFLLEKERRESRCHVSTMKQRRPRSYGNGWLKRVVHISSGIIPTFVEVVSTIGSNCICKEVIILVLVGLVEHTKSLQGTATMDIDASCVCVNIISVILFRALTLLRR